MGQCFNNLGSHTQESPGTHVFFWGVSLCSPKKPFELILFWMKNYDTKDTNQGGKPRLHLHGFSKYERTFGTPKPHEKMQVFQAIKKMGYKLELEPLKIEGCGFFCGNLLFPSIVHF